MNVLIVGATGQTGMLVVKKLVEQRRHSVTVLVRRPEVLAAYKDAVTILKGDATNLQDLKNALTGQDAVISTLGTRTFKVTNLEATFMKYILEAMQGYAIKRFVNLSAWGAGGGARDSYFAMYVPRYTLLKNMYDDKDRGEALLFASKLPYVNVRPGRLTDGKARNTVKASLDGKKTSHSISRADVAHFLIDQLEADVWLGQSPLIGYPR